MIRRIFAGIIAVWMSGIILLLCCGTMEKTNGTEIESRSLGKSGYCNKSKTENVNSNKSDLQIQAICSESASFDC